MEAGHCCVGPGLPGFGRSDKLTNGVWHSYDDQTAVVSSLFEELDLHNVMLVVHDWGGSIGLRASLRSCPSMWSGLSS